MTPMTRNVYDIRVVTAIEPTERAVLLTFKDGAKAIVPGDHRDREIIIHEAERSLTWQHPVGVILDPTDRVVDLSHTHEACVRSVQDYDEDPNRIEVCFWEFSSVCYLTRDHPEFQRIHTTLKDAVASRTPVVFANETWSIRGETEIWLKILDARPVEVPDEQPGVNGAAAREGVPTAADRGG
jgi:hypothetical protein